MEYSILFSVFPVLVFWMENVTFQDGTKLEMDPVARGKRCSLLSFVTDRKPGSGRIGTERDRGGGFSLYDSPRLRYNKQEQMSKLTGGKT